MLIRIHSQYIQYILYGRSRSNGVLIQEVSYTGLLHLACMVDFLNTPNSVKG